MSHNVYFHAEILLTVVFLILIFFVIIIVIYLCTQEDPDTSLDKDKDALEVSVLNTLPILTISQRSADKENDCIECPVCISALTHDEKVRFLPQCNHLFHMKCIDIWFHSNNTCPLCRSTVTAYENTMEGTCDLWKYLETRCLSLKKGIDEMSVIDIPINQSQGVKLPVLGKMESLRRMIRRVISFKETGSGSSSECDIENRGN